MRFLAIEVPLKAAARLRQSYSSHRKVFLDQ